MYQMLHPQIIHTCAFTLDCRWLQNEHCHKSRVFVVMEGEGKDHGSGTKSVGVYPKPDLPDVNQKKHYTLFKKCTN
jgi:hypothetical protein